VIIQDAPKEEVKTIASKETSTLLCSTCGITFEVKEMFKAHYKSELHIENSKLKSKGKPVLTEEEFLAWREEEIDREMFGGKK